MKDYNIYLKRLSNSGINIAKLVDRMSVTSRQYMQWVLSDAKPEVRIEMLEKLSGTLIKINKDINDTRFEVDKEVFFAKNQK